MRIRLFITCVLPVVALLVGCRHEGAYQGKTVSGGGVVVEDQEEVVILSPQLSKRLSFHSLGTQRTEAGRLLVQVEIRNRTDHRQNIDVSTQFRSENGMALPDTSAWQRLSLSPNETRVYEVTSVDGRARAFTIRVREGM